MFFSGMDISALLDCAGTAKSSLNAHIVNREMIKLLTNILKVFFLINLTPLMVNNKLKYENWQAHNSPNIKFSSFFWGLCGVGTTAAQRLYIQSDIYK